MLRIMLAALSLALSLTACGGVLETEQFPARTIVAEECATYFARWYTETGVSPEGIGCYIVEKLVATENAKAVGVCAEYNTGIKYIEILKVYWDAASDSERELLIFHELGHCALGLGHIVGGIMAPFMMDDTHYKENRRTLIENMMNDSAY